MRHGIVLAVGLCLAAGCLARTAPDERASDLRASFERYAQAWSAGDHDVVWNTMSQRLRGNERDVGAFLEYLKKSGTRRVVFANAEVTQTSPTEGEVVAHVTVVAEAGGAVSDVQRLRWVLENGRWVYDGSRQGPPREPSPRNNGS